MRIGHNPHKDQKQEPQEFLHQVIVPVYIPNNEGYFKDSLKILKYCLGSLFKTVHSKTYITIINNGSCAHTVNYLDGLLAQQKIHELIHVTNIGKLNAVLKGLSGHQFPLITIADSDVLFLNHWQEETYRIFDCFPKAGAVCPTPSSRSFRSFTFNIWSELLFSKSLQFTKVKNPEALQAFADSIENADFYNQYHKDLYLTVTKNDCKAVVGAGHFLVTYKNEIFEKLPVKYSSYKLGGNSEKEILDYPVVKSGLWRLSTEDNFALHMGNIYENWMHETFEKIHQEQFVPNNALQYPKNKISKITFSFGYQLFSKLLSKKKIMKWLLIKKGLSPLAVKNYF